MAQQNKKLTPKARLAKSSQEALIEGAAGMSGKIVKKLSRDFLMGAMVKPKITKTPRKKTSKKSLININKKPKTPGQYYTPGTIEMEVLDNKKSTNKMKKESAFKMKGFSGFGNESPVKKDKKLKPEVEQAYSDTILSGMRNRPGYDALDNKAKKSIKESRKRLKGYVATEDEINRSLYQLYRSRGL